MHTLFMLWDLLPYLLIVLVVYSIFSGGSKSAGKPVSPAPGPQPPIVPLQMVDPTAEALTALNVVRQRLRTAGQIDPELLAEKLADLDSLPPFLGGKPAPHP